MKFWLKDSFNVQKIKTKLEELYKINSCDNRCIYIFIFNLWEIISSHIRNEYVLDSLANNNANQTICVEVSLFIHNEWNQTWVIGLLSTEANGIRLEVVPIRNEATLKTIIENHVGLGNTIYSDS